LKRLARPAGGRSAEARQDGGESRVSADLAFSAMPASCLGPHRHGWRCGVVAGVVVYDGIGVRCPIENTQIQGPVTPLASARRLNPRRRVFRAEGRGTIRAS
jgi:hypothetical protein